MAAGSRRLLQMKDIILNALRDRIANEIKPRNPLTFLQRVDPEVYYEELIDTLYVYTRPRKGITLFSEVITGIGRRILRTVDHKADTAVAARVGAFLLWTFEDMGMLQLNLTKGRNGHAQYVIDLLDDEPLAILYKNLGAEHVTSLPHTEPWAPWHNPYHPTGHRLVKTQNQYVLDELLPDRCPLVYEMVNRAQRVGWRIRKEILPVYKWCMKNKADAFMDIWEARNTQARNTKLREAKTIADMAERLGESTFYHGYTLDFRGRKYPITAYLHEQGSDLARSLLQRADKKPMTKEGFDWLLIYLASLWAGDAGRLDGLKTDKISIADRLKWSSDNEAVLLDYASAPTTHIGWMKADEPWQFLAACLELRSLRLYQMLKQNYNDFEYETSFEAYIDGSCNGTQHLVALTRDEITAPHINLVPQKTAGDLYRYVGNHVWGEIWHQLDAYTKEEIGQAKDVIRAIYAMKSDLELATDKGDKQYLHELHKRYRTDRLADIKKAAPVFWAQFDEPSQRRKIAKRGVMTLPYGGTPYGLGEQVLDDAPKHGIPALRHLEKVWASYFGRLLHEDCRTSIARPMRLLGVFEAAGRMADFEQKFLHWNVPVTNFPVVQHYTEGVVKKVWVQYGPPIGEKRSTGYYANTYQLNLMFPEIQVASKGKQQRGISPNCIHSFDAAHLCMTVNACDFPVTTIHDSFGALLPDMPRLFRAVREQFVAFYKSDPLPSVMKDIGGDITNVAFGDLNLELVLDSEFAFI